MSITTATAIPTPTPDADPIADPSASFARFRGAFETRGLRVALGELLAMTDYRFIGLWRFSDGNAAPALHFDRENPAERGAPEVPDTATYCTLVRDEQRPFSTADAAEDSRLAGHPAQHVVRSYCGVPLMTSEGQVLGTLCHYDLVPRNPDQIDLELMLMVSSFVTLNGHLPGYPGR